MIINTKEKAAKLIKKLKEADLVSIDTETKSLTDLTLVAFSVSFDDDDKRYSIPVAMKHIENLNMNDVKAILKAAVCRIGTIYHNYSFDAQVIYPHVPAILQYDPNDTMVLSQLIDETPHTHSLKKLVKRYLNYEMLTFKEVCGTGKSQISFSEVDDEEVFDKYAGDDALMTKKLYIHLYTLVDYDIGQCYQIIERPLLKVVAEMHIRGIPINGTKVEKISKLCQKKVNKYNDKLEKTMKDININSPKQLREFFIDKNNMPVVKYTPTGKPCVDSSVLKKYKSEVQEAEYILEYRKYNKLLSTFIPALRPESDGRIYPTFRQVGTTSGRFSSANPNFQNIPRPSKDNEDLNFRDCIEAPEGKVFVGADYSQMEYRLAAHYSGDQTAIQAYLDGFDMHTKTAEALEITRDKAKTQNFGILYGMSAKSLAERLKTSVEEASEFINKISKTYPDIVKFMIDIKNEAIKVGYITLYGGRRRRLSKQFFHIEDYKREAELRSIANAMIQGSGAMIIKRAMVNMYKELKYYNAYIVAQVHDELLIECPKQHAERVKEIVEECMIAPTKGMKVPFTVDCNIGKTWGEVH